MKPDVTRLFGVAAGHLMTQTAPALGNAYQQSSISVLGMLLMESGQEFERAAQRRVEENAELRRIFADAAPAVQDADLIARLEAAASGTDGSLLISNLDAVNADLRNLLIELHIHVEEQDSPDARRVEEAIWQELVASTERRRIMIGPF